MIPEQNQPIRLAYDKKEPNCLADLTTYRKDDRMAGGKPDPLVIHPAYAQNNEVYIDGRIVVMDAAAYDRYAKESSNDLVNKFGLVYNRNIPMLLHRKLADVLIDTAIDMRDRYQHITVVMDALRTYESGVIMQHNRPDLVASGLLAKAGTSAHNRALAVDSKLFTRDAKGNLCEADEKGHLDDVDMVSNSRFYIGEMSAEARANRLNRLRAWQRASVKNKVPVANLLAEFWDDRVCGSPADLWRVMSCRALCIGIDGNPKTNPAISDLKNLLNQLHATQEQGGMTRAVFAEKGHAAFAQCWDVLFDKAAKAELEKTVCAGAGIAPALADFVFHEWLATIHDDDLQKALGFRQALAQKQPISKQA